MPGGHQTDRQAGPCKWLAKPQGAGGQSWQPRPWRQRKPGSRRPLLHQGPGAAALAGGSRALPGIAGRKPAGPRGSPDTHPGQPSTAHPHTPQAPGAAPPTSTQEDPVILKLASAFETRFWRLSSALEGQAMFPCADRQGFGSCCWKGRAALSHRGGGGGLHLSPRTLGEGLQRT